MTDQTHAAARIAAYFAPGGFPGYTLDEDRAWESITNVGYRPTFGASEELSIETYLLGPLDGEAPRRIRVEFLTLVNVDGAPYVPIKA